MLCSKKAAAYFLMMLMMVGCNPPEQLSKIEQEVGDLKIEVFKLRRQVESGQEVLQVEQKQNQDFRTLAKKANADTQASLAVIEEQTRALANRFSNNVAASRLPAASESAEVAIAPVATLPNDEDANFRAAILDYNRGNYAVSSAAFTSFVELYPKSLKKGEALFFLGLCYYNTKVYDKSQQVFEQIIRELPSSAQFLPSKLKRAQSLLKQNLKPAAVKALQELKEGFPGTQEALIAQQELDDLGL